MFGHSAQLTFGLKRPALTLTDVRPFVLYRSAIWVSNVPAFVLAAVRPKAFGTSLIIDVRSLALGHTWSHVFKHSTFRPFGLMCSNIQPRTLIDSRSFGLYRSTIHLHEHASIGPFDPTDDQPVGLNNVRPLASVVQLVQHSASLTFGNSASTARPSIDTTAPPFDPTDVRPPGGHQRFVHAEALKTEKTLLDLVDVRPKTPRSIEKRDTLPLVVVHPRTPRRIEKRDTLPLNTQNINRSTIHVHERSNSRPFGLRSIRPLISSARQSMSTSIHFDFKRSTIQVHERSNSRPFGLKALDNPRPRAFKQSAVRPQKVFALWFQPLDHPWSRAFKHSVVRPQRYSPFDLDRSTIAKSTKAVGRSTVLIFGLSTSKVFVPLASTARQSLIHGLERSSIRPFDATDVVHSASMTLKAMTWNMTNLEKGSADPAEVIDLKLQNVGPFQSGVQDVKFQLAIDSIDMMLKTMHCIRDQFSTMVNIRLY
ncbi:hypothetical protein LR48_Vigan270s000600 [Vigna angularis]|uniref:Uncharacterized protein n=1 Tax=Phaseolus angularis TaxID=3914 RepID=A0A0L9T8J1_PHAAN|nr:hypothetical protein LR48_Vigan270s000600 [Vigna angularis]